MAWLMSSALKKTQAKEVIAKVEIIAQNSLREGNSFPLATISKLFLLFPDIRRGKKKSAFNAPQAMKVQFAPCQNPLIINIINVFLVLLIIPPRLPPKGM